MTLVSRRLMPLAEADPRPSVLYITPEEVRPLAEEFSDLTQVGLHFMPATIVEQHILRGEVWFAGIPVRISRHAP